MGDQSAAGNVIDDGIHGYTYDAENRTVKVDGGGGSGPHLGGPFLGSSREVGPLT